MEDAGHSPEDSDYSSAHLYLFNFLFINFVKNVVSNKLF